ncbi:HD domain-containing protein [Chitinophaga nivalis]|uniref:HDIG domain-containing protein n=1 Tax=Chitinophaga nivalis TaxID=2991709 RepID=A0ABT3ILP0_9BACT|nr:HDIG domain-containing metalloprotein [Chitinophaga nivalis]MCW3465450.1 HDIG domain-containing protein [Chitinophaga nivalis]MCW3484858.1 HDIG domain-containing protein [Chitinophaga nivalis]
MDQHELQATAIADKIFNLYATHGHLEYGENVTMLMHMMQSALIAENTGFSDEMILAAFLHDIGHFFEEETQMGVYGTQAHDDLGGAFLRECGFPEKLISLVASHVAAKRYLTSIDSAYYDTLSEASKQTLEYQGGPMSEEEAAIFRSDPFYQQYIQIRIWDDMGKITEVPVLPEDVTRMKARTRQYLLQHMTLPPEQAVAI